jgi:hypothetical protein
MLRLENIAQPSFEFFPLIFAQDLRSGFDGLKKRISIDAPGRP